ncbi:MAG: sugar phosphate isomerase/epimerase [Alicyclobacillus sp.]|nr:sugar phosphate isomerase/epimerase [Alicyclobacillus sp.]
MARMGVALQLYTIRQALEQDFLGSLRQVAAAGYEGVEFAGLYGQSAATVRALLDELQLTAVSSHLDLRLLEDDFDAVVEDLKTLGCKNAVVPYIADNLRQDEAGWKAVFAKLEQFGAQFAAHGIRFGYHNHSFEFEHQVDGQWAFDALFAATNPAHVQVEMDVCWVQVGGQDPVAYIHKYEGRLPLLHLKDMRLGEDGKPLTVPLGQGSVDLSAVVEASQAAGVEWLIVEQDFLQHPPFESIGMSMQWLRDHSLR